jgi:hypothetical protein
VRSLNGLISPFGRGSSFLDRGQPVSQARMDLISVILASAGQGAIVGGNLTNKRAVCRCSINGVGVWTKDPGRESTSKGIGTVRSHRSFGAQGRRRLDPEALTELETQRSRSASWGSKIQPDSARFSIRCAKERSASTVHRARSSRPPVEYIRGLVNTRSARIECCQKRHAFSRFHNSKLTSKTRGCGRF